MTNGELQYELRQLPADCQVWLPVWNGHVETYGVVDDVDAHHYPSIQNDFFGTPGRTDSRCFSEFRGLGQRELDETDVNSSVHASEASLRKTSTWAMTTSTTTSVLSTVPTETRT